MKRAILIVALIASLTAGAAAATDSTNPQSPANPTANPAPKKKGFDPSVVVCKRERPTGTLIGGKEICMTWAQWDQISHEDVDALRRPPEVQPPTSMGAAGPGGMGR